MWNDTNPDEGTALSIEKLISMLNRQKLILHLWDCADPFLLLLSTGQNRDFREQDSSSKDQHG